MNCVSPVRITKNLDRNVYPDGLLVPCGKCIACRIAKRKEWTLRMWHELDDFHGVGRFVTLTYDDDYLPYGETVQYAGFDVKFPTLVKEDLQKFFKRLRKNLDGRKIRYFACGEYGDETERPHYHAIIFGLSICDDKYIKDCWPFGFVYCGNVEPDSINYVAKYINKQYSGELADFSYTQKDRNPVFRLMSIGIGSQHCMANSKQYIENEKITMHGNPMSFPRYYIKKLGLENSDFRKDVSIKNDKKLVKTITGIDKTQDELYRQCAPDIIKKFEEAKSRIYKQHENNLNACIALKNNYKKSKKI